ncbi:MAG: flippase-like domain-containing protein [Tannerellaceae bacterium]|nr:flippase-like domain-containing protein [Tannerellaceae bacterium]
MDFKKLLSTTLKVILPLALGVALLWYIYKDTDFNEMWLILKQGVRYDILAFSLLFGLAGNVIRAIRWGLLISSLGEKFRMSNLIYAVQGNYAINFILPRVGEVWRCGVISKYEKISFTKLIGTLLVDRVSDTVTVGLITLFIFIFNFNFFSVYFGKNPAVMEGFNSILNSSWLVPVLIIVAGIIWFVFTYMSNYKLVQKIKGILWNIWEGMKSVWLMDKKIMFILQTLAIWTGYFLYFYLTFYAFDFTKDLGIVAGLMAFTMSSIGVAAPVQGGMGAWHFMVYTTLMRYGVEELDAKAFAMVVFAVQSIWVVLCGIVGIVALPLTNKEEPATEN